MSCQICLEEYKGRVKPIACQYCPSSSCRKCLEQYLLQTYEDPHCLTCKRGWTPEFLAANFTLSFRGTELRKHRRTILFEREKSFLPSMQVYVEAKRVIEASFLERDALYAKYRGPGSISERFWEYIKRLNTARGTYMTKRSEVFLKKAELQKVRDNKTGETEAAVRKKCAELALVIDRARKEREAYKQAVETLKKDNEQLAADHTECEEAINAVNTRWQEAHRLYEGTTANTVKREFIMKCGVEECRGFLSTVYKCGVCDSWTCPDCLVVLGKDKAVEHTCKPDMVESAKAIKAETQPCPKCAARIYKIDGCFAKDTPVLLWNGTSKLAQDICVGDALVGDDGQKRVVETTCAGEDEMYEVTQTRGDSYTVNSKHKLALKPYNHISSRSDPLWIAKWFNGQSFSTKQFTVEQDAHAFLTGLNLPEVVEMTVDDYTKLSQASRDLLYGYRSHDIHWPHKDVHVDPYLMGLWIGDGINNGMDFACNPEWDPEIVNYILNWCDRNGSELIHDDAYRFRVRRAGLTQGRDAIRHGATSAECKGCIKKACSLCDLPDTPVEQIEMQSKNPLKDALDHYGLIKNKHIPIDYIVNDRQTRLQLLAGLIDTDGHVCNDGKRVQIAQSNHSIAKQIALIARSLGFVVSVDTVKKDNVSFPGREPKDYPPHLRVSISGMTLSEIPTRVQRKVCSDSAPNKDWFKTSIDVKPVGKGAYYGWSIDGNKRFVLEDQTVVRNCDQMWCTVEGCNTAFSWKTGHVVTGVVHNPHYYEWLRRNGGAAGPAREAGDIPCGGLPNYWIILQAFRTARILPSESARFESIHRNLVEFGQRLTEYPARMPQLLNKDINVSYLMNRITEPEWKRQLEFTEAKFNRKKEIGQILQTLVTASADIMNQVANRCETAVDEDLRIALRMWLADTVLPELEGLRAYTNQAFKDLAVRNHMAVPQIADDWQWIPIRALYRKKKPVAAAADTDVPPPLDMTADAVTA